MWPGCGSDVFSDVARMWLGRVFGCDRKSLAEVKGKRFPARPPDYSSNLCPPKTFAIGLFRGGFWALFLRFSYTKARNTW